MEITEENLTALAGYLQQTLTPDLTTRRQGSACQLTFVLMNFFFIPIMPCHKIMHFFFKLFYILDKNFCGSFIDLGEGLCKLEL